MLYEGSESMGNGDDDCGSGEGGKDVYKGKTEPVLVSVSDSYSKDEIISVCGSRPSSSPAYTITDYLSTDYCPKENVCDLDLRRLFYSKQGFYELPAVPLYRHTTRGCVAQG